MNDLRTFLLPPHLADEVVGLNAPEPGHEGELGAAVRVQAGHVEVHAAAVDRVEQLPLQRLMGMHGSMGAWGSHGFFKKNLRFHSIQAQLVSGAPRRLRRTSHAP